MGNIQNLMSGIIFTVLLGCVLAIALAFISLDQFKYNNLLININCASLFLIIRYIYCHFSEKMASTSDVIGDVLYDSSWYEMSTIEQKAIILMIQRSQRKFRLTGLGLVDCSLASFLTVIIIISCFKLLFK